MTAYVINGGSGGGGGGAPSGTGVVTVTSGVFDTPSSAADITQDGLDAIVGAAPAGYTVVSDGAGDLDTTSADVSAVLAAADAAGMRAALGVGGTLAPIWQRPAPAWRPAGGA